MRPDLDSELVGRRGLVTGSTQGTGAAVAELLRAPGAVVWRTARNRPADDPDPEHFVTAELTTASGCDHLARTIGEGGGAEASTHSSMS